MIWRFLLLCLFSLPARAETINPLIAKNDVCGAYEVFHINGVNTDIDGAQRNLVALIGRYGNAHEGHLIQYGLAYNETRGAAVDFMDAFQQTVLDYPGVTFQAWVRAVMLAIFTDSITVEIAAAISARLQQLVDLNRPSTYFDSDLASIINALRVAHRAGGRMLLVPHSQGALYANLVYDRLVAGTGSPVFQVPAQSVAIVAVATPANNVRRGEYVTAQNDRIINFVRNVFSDTLAHNVELTQSALDPLNHNLRDVYLTETNSRNEIVAKMQSVLTSLKGTATTYQGTPLEYFRYTRTANYIPCGPTRPCTFAGVTYVVPIIVHPWPRIPQGVFRPGSVGELEGVATAVVQACYTNLVDSALLHGLAGPPYMGVATDVPGCEARPH